MRLVCATPVFALVFASLLLLASCASRPQERPPTWIDVRTPAEFAAGHLPGAVNIPHAEIADRVGELRLGPDDPIYLYCGSGRRAGLAQASLQSLGYSRVTNVGTLQDALDRAKTEPVASG